MIQNTISTTLERWQRAGLVPVVRAPNADLALTLCRALVGAGMQVLEVTMTVPEAPRVIETLRRENGDRVLVGGGTVTDLRQLTSCLDAGAQFVVTPVGLPELVGPAHDAGVAIALGALTPTEVWNAWVAGADVVKVFPASAVGGADYVRALKAPFPDVKLMPTGGITLGSLGAFISAGAFAVGVGGALVDVSQLRTSGPGSVTEQARAYVAKLAEARSTISDCA